MTHEWPIVPLAKVIHYRKEFIKINDLEKHKRPRVQSHARGIVLRDEVPGAEIKTKQQQVCRAGEFLVAEIDAKVGGYGIVPEDLDGSLVSSHYFLFEIDSAQLDQGFLDYFIRTPAFHDQVAAQGSTNYAAIRANDVLGYEIPLPPLDEQRRLVTRIEALAAKIEEARGLRRLAVEEAEALVKSNLSSVYESLADTVQSLGDHAVQIADGPHVTPNYVETGFPFVTVRNIANRRLDLHNLKYVTKEDHEMFCKRARPERGDVLYTKDGTLGTPCYIDTDKEFSFFVSVALIKPKRDALDGRYLTYILDAPQVHDQVTQNKTGAVLAHIVLRAIKAIQIPVPPLEEQHCIVAYLDGLQGKVDALKQLQAQTQVELDALLPSVLDKAFKGEL
jgi:type I restriction enzyme, S subunit